MVLQDAATVVLSARASLPEIQKNKNRPEFDLPILHDYRIFANSKRKTDGFCHTFHLIIKFING